MLTGAEERAEVSDGGYPHLKEQPPVIRADLVSCSGILLSIAGVYAGGGTCIVLTPGNVTWRKVMCQETRHLSGFLTYKKAEISKYDILKSLINSCDCKIFFFPNTGKWFKANTDCGLCLCCPQCFPLRFALQMHQKERLAHQFLICNSLQEDIN